ncbi:dihydroorotase [Thermodesulfobacteriota bacterium]
MPIWIKDGDVVDPVRGVVQRLDIIIEHGHVKRIMPQGLFKEQGTRLRIVDASGKIVVPGLVDMHVHLREPGYEHKETIATGSLAGVAGGFTALACMPNTDPANDNSSVTGYILAQARKTNLLEVYPIASITKGLKGEVLTDFSALRKAGAIGVSDDGFPVRDPEVMKQATEEAHENGLTIISHCEDTDLSRDGVMHEGVISSRLGLKGIPSGSEEVAIKREIAIAEITGCPVHIAHVSTKGSVEVIRWAKEESVPVTAETAPHYFSLDHKAVIGYNTNTKMNPPLRTPEDVEAIKQGLKDGVIDVIATDHAPHSRTEKKQDFDKAPFGILGLETAVPLTLNLVRDGILSLPDAIRKLSYNPANILNVSGGFIEEGSEADLAIIDTECAYVLKEEDFHSKSINSPFIGKSLKGKNVLTIVKGRIVWERDV